MMRKRLTLLLVVVISCEEGSPPADGPLISFSDTIAATVVAEIGQLEGEADYLFGDVQAIAADESGRIFVADGIGSTIRAYDADGRFLALIGREGSGPGEFEAPADVTFGPDGRFFVRDASRITVLAPAASGALADSVVATWAIGTYGNLRSTRSRVDAYGRYLYPKDMLRDTLPHFYVPFVDGVETADTIAVPSYPTMSRSEVAFYRTSARGGRIVDGLAAAPFAAIPAWDVTREATVISGDAESYVLYETDAAGDTVRVIRGPADRRAVPERDLADSLAALRARVDSLPVPLAQVENLDPDIRDQRWPEVLPAYTGVHYGESGHIWVAQWPPVERPDHRLYHVFGRNGEPVAVVLLPAPLVRDTPPFFTDSMVYGVVRDPDTGVERVVALRLATALSESEREPGAAR